MLSSVPSCAARDVYTPVAAVPSFESARAIKSKVRRRVRASTMSNTCSIGSPHAWLADLPVNREAMGLSDCTRPCASVVMTASPIESSVTRSSSS